MAPFKFNFLTKVSEIESKQKKVVSILKERFPLAFNGLDENTYNRWLNGRTSPSMYKKMLIYMAFNLSFEDILLNEGLNKSERESKVFERYFDKLDQSVFLGNYIAYNKCIDIVVDTLCKDEFRKEFDSFYINNSAYMNIRSVMDKEDKKYSFNVVRALMNDTKVGHLAYSNKIDRFTTCALGISDDEYSDYFCVLPMYYMDGDVLKRLISVFLMEIIKKKLYLKNNGLFLISNPISASFFETALKGKLIKYYFPLGDKNKYDKGLYLYKVDLIYMLSIPYIYNLVKGMMCD
ncbi:hypothetical protein [Vibrio owensii]|uniref:hypothetical protein n=1 Tax=Vibrio owensii TaxID=696485 RepID=UPI0022DE52AD|nr:hypothetical protein [Vibrio owensii]MDA0382936.1 hypothetical protein [Vibrio owensii]